MYIRINTSHSPYWADMINTKAKELDVTTSALFRLLYKEVYLNENKYGLTPERMEQLKLNAEKRKKTINACVVEAIEIWLDKVAYLPRFL